MVVAFVSTTQSITSLPTEVRTAIEMVSLCTSIPIYFVLSMEGVPFCRDSGEHPNLTPKGAPFYIASSSRNVGLARFPVSENAVSRDLASRTSKSPCSYWNVALGSSTDFHLPSRSLLRYLEWPTRRRGRRRSCRKQSRPA